MRKELDIAIRMKSYELDQRLNSEQPIIIRLDGRAFHTFTRKMVKPFCNQLQNEFVQASIAISKDLQGVQCFYHQSDEVSFLLMKSRPESEIFLGGRVDKINSVTASLFTSNFRMKNASFDCRCFNIPKEDVEHYFYWRVMDARRNSINAVAQSLYSQKQLNGKNISETLALVNQSQKPWEEYPHWAKYGSLVWRNRVQPEMTLDNIKDHIRGILLMAEVLNETDSASTEC